LTPGFIPATALTRDIPAYQRFFVKLVSLTPFVRTISQGGREIVNCAIGEETGKVSGNYYYDLKVTKPSKEALNEEKQAKFWDLSLQWTNLSSSNSNDGKKE